MDISKIRQIKDTDNLGAISEGYEEFNLNVPNFEFNEEFGEYRAKTKNVIYVSYKT